MEVLQKHAGLHVYESISEFRVLIERSPTSNKSGLLAANNPLEDKILFCCLLSNVYKEVKLRSICVWLVYSETHI